VSVQLNKSTGYKVGRLGKESENYKSTGSKNQSTDQVSMKEPRLY